IQRDLPHVNEDGGRFLNAINVGMQSLGKSLFSDLPRAAATIGVAASNKLFGYDVDPNEVPISQFFKGVGEDLEEIFPGNPKFQDEFLTTLVRGGGQLAGIIGVGLATGGVGTATFGA